MSWGCWPLMRRRDMRPGTIFEVVSSSWHMPELRVVLDEKTETDFWRGGTSAIGDVSSAVAYRVVAFPKRPL